MTIVECISEIVSSVKDTFETNQEKTIEYILQAQKVIILDTCFITKSTYIQTEALLRAFEIMAGGKESQKIVFVITELVLYELKDSSENVLQEKNKAFFEKLRKEGFCLVLLREEKVCEMIRPFMSYSIEEWNNLFTRLLRENIANLTFHSIMRTDKRIPYFGFVEYGYQVPSDVNFIPDIILYLKNRKKRQDSMAEEMICMSILCIFELVHGSARNEYIFCTHDFKAVARMNKTIHTSYADMHKQMKTINSFSMLQYMIEKEIIKSKEIVKKILTKLYGNEIKLIIREGLPFAPTEKTLTIEDAVERIFNNEQIDLVGRE